MIKTLFAILTAFVFLFVLTGKVPSSADDLVTQFNHNTLTLAVLAIGSFVIYSLLLGPSKKARKNTTAAPRRKLTAAEAAQRGYVHLFADDRLALTPLEEREQQELRAEAERAVILAKTKTLSREQMLATIAADTAAAKREAELKRTKEMPTAEAPGFRAYLDKHGITHTRKSHPPSDSGANHAEG